MLSALDDPNRLCPVLSFQMCRARSLWIQDGFAWGELRLSHHLEGEALQVFRLWNGRDHWMVWRLTVNRHTTKNPPGVECRCQNHILERCRIGVVRSAKSRRAVAVPQPPCCAIVSLKKKDALAGGLNEGTITRFTYDDEATKRQRPKLPAR